MDDRWREVEEIGSQMGFISEYNHTIDPKGRLIIPTKFRCELGSSFIVTRGIDKCLYLYPMKTWEKFQENLATLPINNEAARTFVTFMSGGASQVDMDSQGRILIPGYLREYSDLIKDVVLIGSGARIELWSKERRDQKVKNIDINAISEALGSQGFNIGLGM